MVWIFKTTFSISLLSSVPLCFSRSNLSFVVKHWIHSYIKGKTEGIRAHIDKKQRHSLQGRNLLRKAAEFFKAHPLTPPLEVHQTPLLAPYSQTFFFQRLHIMDYLYYCSNEKSQCPVWNTFPFTEFCWMRNSPALWAQRSLWANLNEIRLEGAASYHSISKLGTHVKD